METNLTVCKYKNLKKQCIQMMSVSIIEYYANIYVPSFFFINPHQGNVIM